ncbi:unnamed protein product [Lactuca saligna]|uniref:Uncharacterized protein n=1 Tax=Lactuca saligna TaxID=75948 RepID=A0AA35YLY3_LACSI|nr:unnamed protein product [Lactuca saligna]
MGVQDVFMDYFYNGFDYYCNYVDHEAIGEVVHPNLGGRYIPKELLHVKSLITPTFLIIRLAMLHEEEEKKERSVLVVEFTKKHHHQHHHHLFFLLNLCKCQRLNLYCIIHLDPKFCIISS